MITSLYHSSQQLVCEKPHICPHKKNPWSRLGSSDLLNASRYSWTITLKCFNRAPKNKYPVIWESNQICPKSTPIHRVTNNLQHMTVQEYIFFLQQVGLLGVV